MKPSRNYRPALKTNLRRTLSDKPTMFSIALGILILLSAYGFTDFITMAGDIPSHSLIDFLVRIFP